MEVRGDIVKQLRMSRSWTQQQLSEICDVNLRTVQRVENQGAASIETIMALCVAFDVSREALFEVPKPAEGAQPVKVRRLMIIVFAIGTLVGAALSLLIFQFM